MSEQTFTSEDLQRNLMTPSQVADTLGISKQLAGKILAKEGIQTLKVGAAVFVMRGDLANWLTDMAERVKNYQPGAAPTPDATAAESAPPVVETEAADAEAQAVSEAEQAVAEAEQTVSSGRRR